MAIPQSIRNNPRFIDLTGKHFSRWTVLRYLGQSKWECQCRCNTIKAVCSRNLRHRISKSCSCLQKEAAIKSNKKRGEAARNSPTSRKNNPKLVHSFSNMRDRCLNPYCKDYPEYGGRGIQVAPQWARFKQFVIDVGPPPSPWHTLDRKDNNGHYEPGNVRWSLPIEQSNNMRSNVHVTYRGETHTIAQWLRLLQITRAQLNRYVANGEATQSESRRKKQNQQKPQSS